MFYCQNFLIFFSQKFHKFLRIRQKFLRIYLKFSNIFLQIFLKSTYFNYLWYFNLNVKNFIKFLFFCVIKEYINKCFSNANKF